MILNLLNGLFPQKKPKFSYEQIERLNSRIKLRTKEKVIGDDFTIRSSENGNRIIPRKDGTWEEVPNYRDRNIVLMGDVTAEDMTRWMVVRCLSEKYWNTDSWGLVVYPKDLAPRFLKPDEIINSWKYAAFTIRL
jgi:hypothetical protein